MSNTINKPLAAKVLAALLEFPHNHDQTTWQALSVPTYEKYLEQVKRGEDPKPVNLTCGSSACAAGWTTHLHGDLIDVNMVAYDEDSHQYVVHYIVEKETGRSRMPGYRAAELLNITDEDLQSELFCADTEEKHVVKALIKLIDGKSEATVATWLLSKS